MATIQQLLFNLHNIPTTSLPFSLFIFKIFCMIYSPSFFPISSYLLLWSPIFCLCYTFYLPLLWLGVYIIHTHTPKKTMLFPNIISPCLLPPSLLFSYLLQSSKTPSILCPRKQQLIFLLPHMLMIFLTLSSCLL
jgi:hypothetical protein